MRLLQIAHKIRISLIFSPLSSLALRASTLVVEMAASP